MLVTLIPTNLNVFGWSSETITFAYALAMKVEIIIPSKKLSYCSKLQLLLRNNLVFNLCHRKHTLYYSNKAMAYVVLIA